MAVKLIRGQIKLLLPSWICSNVHDEPVVTLLVTSEYVKVFVLQ